MSLKIDSKFLKDFLSFEKLASLFLRGVSILSRFLIVFFLTKEISLEFQGQYTLLNTTISILVIFLGLDLYVYITRQIIRVQSNYIFFLKQLLFFNILIYVLFGVGLFFLKGILANIGVSINF